MKEFGVEETTETKNCEFLVPLIYLLIFFFSTRLNNYAVFWIYRESFLEGQREKDVDEIGLKKIQTEHAIQYRKKRKQAH